MSSKRGYGQREVTPKKEQSFGKVEHNTMEVAILAKCLGCGVLLTRGQQELIGTARIMVGCSKINGGNPSG